MFNSLDMRIVIIIIGPLMPKGIVVSHITCLCPSVCLFICPSSVWHALINTPQPTMFNGSWSYLVQPHLSRSMNPADHESLCSFSGSLWHLEISWIHTGYCLEPYLITHLQPTISNRSCYTPRTTKLLGGILVSFRPSVCPSVRPSRIRPASVPHHLSAL